MKTELLRRLAVALLFVAGLAAFLAALASDDPLFLALPERAPTFLLVVAILGVIGALFFEIRLPRRSHVVLALILLWSATPITLALKHSFARQRISEVISAPAPAARRLGAHFLVGYDKVEEIEPLASQGWIGGVFITKRNVAGRSVEDVRAEIDRLQAGRRAAGLPPLIVATDQEGGRVARLSPPLAAPPSLAALAGLAPEARVAQARRQGETAGADLARIGVNLDFAPVVDLQGLSAGSTLDFGSHVEQRAISSDPAVVSEIAIAFAEGLEARGVEATFKHFPGLGRVDTDTHLFQASLDADEGELARADWAPFRAGLSRTSAALMVAHVSLRARDADRPASQSRAVIDGLLRREWGFDGLIVTDDLAMGAVYRHDICDGVADSLNAGADLLLVGWDGRQYYLLMRCLLNANARGHVDATMLMRSSARLERFTGRLGG